MRSTVMSATSKSRSWGLLLGLAVTGFVPGFLGDMSLIKNTSAPKVVYPDAASAKIASAEAKRERKAAQRRKQV